MNSLVKRKQRWELENSELLQRILQQAFDALIIALVRVGRILSFLLFLIFIFSKGCAALFWALFRGPKLVRVIAPNQFQERHEFEEANQHRLPPLWR
jgi:hypothetical protein